MKLIALVPAPIRRPLLMAVLALALVMVTGTGVAFAHAYLVRSEPAANAVLDSPPALLKLWFSERPELRFTEVQLSDSTGRAIGGMGSLSFDPSEDALVVARFPELARGIYTVAWRALSTEDGHVVSGRFAFAVGREQVPPGGFGPAGEVGVAGASTTTPLGVATGWFGYLGLMLLFGGFLFLPLVLGPALEGSGAQPSEVQSGSTEASPGAEPTGLGTPPYLLPLLGMGWAAAMAAALVGVVNQAATSAGVSLGQALEGPLAILLFDTRYGTLFWARLLQLALVGGLLAYIYRQVRRGGAVAGWWWWAGAEFTAGVLLILSMGSHAAAVDNPLFTIGLDWLHLMAAGLWAGGLACLFLAVPWLRRVLGPKAPLAVTVAVNSFSQLATYSVIALAATGLYRTVLEVGDRQNFLDTPYGLALLAKLALVVPLLGLGAVNVLLLKRRLQAVSQEADPAAVLPWHRRLRRTVGGEVLLVFGVLLATSVLVSLPPSRSVYGPGLAARAQVADLRAVLVINPGTAGFNSFDVYLRDSLARPVEAAEKVALLISRPGEREEPAEAVAQAAGGGRYSAAGGYLSTTGRWSVQILVRRSGEEDVRLPVSLSVFQGH